MVKTIFIWLKKIPVLKYRLCGEFCRRLILWTNCTPATHHNVPIDLPTTQDTPTYFCRAGSHDVMEWGQRHRGTVGGSLQPWGCSLLLGTEVSFNENMSEILSTASAGTGPGSHCVHWCWETTHTGTASFLFSARWWYLPKGSSSRVSKPGRYKGWKTDFQALGVTIHVTHPALRFV